MDFSFDPGTGANDIVHTIALQPDGKIILGGIFGQYDGISRNRIVRLNSDGTLDESFDPGTGTKGWGGHGSSIYTAIVQDNGKILIGGSFMEYNGTSRKNIASLNSNGSLDTTFDLWAEMHSGELHSIMLQPDGKIIIGASTFTYDNDSITKGVARINSDGTVDQSFDSGKAFLGTVFTTALQRDGKILIGGSFTAYNGIKRGGFARLNSDGTLDELFDPGASPYNVVYSIGIQPDGKIITGGRIFDYNGIIRNNIARLHNDGTLDTSFHPGSGTTMGELKGEIRAIVLQTDGKIITGGKFNEYNGTGRNHITRLMGASVTGVDNGLAANVLNIYPNPSVGRFSIETTHHKPVSYRVFNSMGQLMQQGTVYHYIDLGDKPAGVYLLRIEDEMFRLVKN